MRFGVPLVPKNPDGLLRVVLIGRISSPHQPESNIEAGYEYARGFLDGMYDGPMEIREFGERGSGMLVERETILEAIDEISTRRWDVVLMEDCSKSYRNPRWMMAFVQDCVDLQVRVIAPGDTLDTADENWEVVLAAAVLRHGLHIPDTRRRVRRTAVYSFHRGGMVQRVRYGYRKLSKDEANSGQFGPKGLQIARLAECTPVIREMRRRFLQGDRYVDVANWLNEEGILPGASVTKGRWTGQLVYDLFRDPVLSGTRRWRQEIYDPIYKTGKHRRRKNPEPDTEHYHELEHMTREEQEELWAAMDARRLPASKRSTGPHPLKDRPRKDSIWPGQHARCAVCGELMYRTLNDQLKCKNAFSRNGCSCWNHVQLKADQARKKIIPLIVDVLDRHPDFREMLIEAVWTELQKQIRRRQRKSGDRERTITRLEQEQRNLAKAIREGGKLETLILELKRVERELTTAREQHAADVAQAEQNGSFFTRADVAERIGEAIEYLAANSFEFAKLMRRMIPWFVIQPVQALDSGQVRPRGKLILRIRDDDSQNGEEPNMHELNLTVDLFDPPKHIDGIAECLAAQANSPAGTGLRKLAAELGLNYMTVKRSLAYAKRMDEQGISDPYVELHDRPAKAARWSKRRRTA